MLALNLEKHMNLTQPHLLPRPSPVLKGFGVVAGLAIIGVATALAFEQCRRRELVRTLASMPGAAGIFPALHAHSSGVLAQFGVGPLPSARSVQASAHTPQHGGHP